MDAFTPADYVAVEITPADRANPYRLARPLLYHNEIVHVTCEAGFAWDGASVPYWWPALVWSIMAIANYLYPTVAVSVLTVLAIFATLRMLPWMQRIGPHVRAACVHDKLYRSRLVDRVIADGIMLSIMKIDKIPLDVRVHIYCYLRLFGWIAWNSHSEEDRTTAARSVGFTPTPPPSGGEAGS